jgi:hypothetical protein
MGSRLVMILAFVTVLVLFLALVSREIDRRGTPPAPAAQESVAHPNLPQ